MPMEEKRMNKNEELYVTNAATNKMAESTNVRPPEVTTMEKILHTRKLPINLHKSPWRCATA